MSQNQEVDVQAVINEMRAVQHKSKLFMEALTEKSSLSINQIMLLMDLKLTGSMRITEISERFSVTAGAATSMCDRLEVLELVQRLRSKEDRRVVSVTLTDQGEGIVDDIFKALPDNRLLAMLAAFRQMNQLLSDII